MVPHETVWGMRQARSPAFWGVPIGMYRMTGDEILQATYINAGSSYTNYLVAFCHMMRYLG
jgi:hypothetical protein